MNSSQIVMSRYKPYRYTIHGNTLVIDSSQGKYVIKKQQNDLYTLYNYLDSRGFNNHPRIDYNFHNQENIYEYVENTYLPDEQRLEELAKVVASLHNKTVFFKTISDDNLKEIYDIILENIDYMVLSYEGMFLNACKKEFQSPSEYLFCRNYYQIKRALDYAKSNLDKWYSGINTKQFRVSIIHNNLKLDHFIYNPDLSILISWDNYRVDSPLIDIVNLYKNDFDKYDWHSFFKIYFNQFELLESEKELLFVMLAIPFLHEESNESEFIKTQHMYQLIEYIQKTGELIRTYNSKEKKEE